MSEIANNVLFSLLPTAFALFRLLYLTTRIVYSYNLLNFLKIVFFFFRLPNHRSLQLILSLPLFETSENMSFRTRMKTIQSKIKLKSVTPFDWCYTYMVILSHSDVSCEASLVVNIWDTDNSIKFLYSNVTKMSWIVLFTSRKMRKKFE